MVKYVYPGSFDPVQLGHLDMIKRAAKLCDKLIVALLINTQKTTLYTVEERKRLLESAIGKQDNIEILSFSGLLIHFMESVGSHVIVKGLRSISDFDIEMQMARINTQMNHEIETIFLVSDPRYSFLSSSMIKEIAAHNGSIEEFIPAGTASIVLNKFR